MMKVKNVWFKRASATLSLTILFFCSVTAQELGEIGFDTTAASIGRMKLFGIGSDAYFRSWTGPMYRLLTSADIAAGNVLTSSYSPGWSSISGKPTTIAGYGITDFAANWLGQWNTYSIDLYPNTIAASEVISSPTIHVTELFVEDQLYVNDPNSLNTEYTGKPGQVLVKRGNYPAIGGINWDSLAVSDIRDRNRLIEVDTLSGRAIFQIDEPAASLIPDSSHFVIEQDYVKVWQVTDYFDTLTVDWTLVIVGRDSVELTFPRPNYDFSWEISCFCFDQGQIGYYDSISYYLFRYDDNRDILDSVIRYKAQSIMYFADTLWDSSRDNFTNYLSTEHHLSEFRLKQATFNLEIAWDNKQKQFYIK